MVERICMSKAFWEIADRTSYRFVGLRLEVGSGYAVYGGELGDLEFERFLTVDGRLVVAPSIAELMATLPPTGSHPFTADARFAEFCDEIRWIDLYVAHAEDADRLRCYDFVGVLTALREREVFHAPHSRMTIDCLGAAIDLGRQVGRDSRGYQLARYGPLDDLYEAIWAGGPQQDGEPDPADELDFVTCEAAWSALMEWIEGLGRRPTRRDAPA